MILQVAFTRVDAENRSVVWHALNLPGADGDLLLLLFNSSLNLAWKFGWLATWSPGEQHSNLASTMSQLCGSSESYFLTCPQTCASLYLPLVNDPAFFVVVVKYLFIFGCAGSLLLQASFL